MATTDELLKQSTQVAQEAAESIGGTFEQGVGFTPNETTPNVLTPEQTEKFFETQSTAATPLSPAEFQAQLNADETISGDSLSPAPSVTVEDTPDVPVPDVSNLDTTNQTDTPEVDDSILDLETAVSGVADFDRESRISAETADVEKRLNEINKRIELQKVEALETEEQALERGTTQRFAAGEAQRVRRTAAIEAMKLSAEKAAIQGELALATDLAERAVDEEFKQRESELRTARRNILLNYDNLSAADKKRADIILEEIGQESSLIEEKKQTQKDIENIAIEAASVDAPSSVINEIRNSNDPVEAARLAAPYLSPEQGELRSEIIGGFEVLRDSQGNIVSTKSVPTSTTKPPSATERKVAQFAQRITDANEVIDDVGDEFTGFSSRIGQILPQGLKSDDRQRFEQAQRNFVNAILRRESGAAIAPSEFESAQIQYFPQPGDSKAVLEQKKRNREAIQNSLILEAGDAFTELSGTLPPPIEKVTISGREFVVGSIIESGGIRGRVNADGTISPLIQ